MFGGGTFLLVQEGRFSGEQECCGDDQDILFEWHAAGVYRHDSEFLQCVDGINSPPLTRGFDFRVVFCEIGRCGIGRGSDNHHFCVKVHELPPKSSNVRVLSIIGYIVEKIKREGLFRLFDDLGENGWLFDC